jgi:hypothetical protein
MCELTRNYFVAPGIPQAIGILSAGFLAAIVLLQMAPAAVRIAAH